MRNRPRTRKDKPYTEGQYLVAIGIVAAVALLVVATAVLSFTETNEYVPDPEADKAAVEREAERALEKRGILLRVKAKMWLEENLKDPASLEIVEWGKPALFASGELSIVVRYRAKNSFGGYVVENWIFSMNKDDQIACAENIGDLER